MDETKKNIEPELDLPEEEDDQTLPESQEDFADFSNFVFLSTAFSSSTACSPANFQSCFSMASVNPGNSRCA